MLTSSTGFLKEHASAVLWCMRLIDISVIVITAVFSHWYYFGHLHITTAYWHALLYSVLLALLIYPRSGVYSAWRGARYYTELKALCIAYSALFLTLIVLAFVLKVSADYSRLWVGYWYITGLVLWCSIRLSLRVLLRYSRARAFNIRRVLIVGTGEHAQAVGHNLNNAPWTGLSVVGYVNTNDRAPSNRRHSVVCHVDAIADYLAYNPVDQVWIAVPATEGEKIKKTLAALELSAVGIRLVPDLFGLTLLNHSVTEVNGMPVLNLSISPIEGIDRLVKSIEDKLLAAVILTLVSPLMLIIAVAIKASSPGPVFYRQARVGWNSKPFQMLKFRSMPMDTEAQGVTWGTGAHKPVTPLGGLLRKISLDELPQLINVLKGDMSIVGPRPERTVFVDQFKNEISRYMKKHLVKAGITGWAQVNGWRGDTDLKQRIDCDMYYITHWSLWFDLKIMALTVLKGFVHKNAR